MALWPAFQEAASPVIADVAVGRIVRDGGRSASCRLSAAPSSAYAADSSSLPLNTSTRASATNARATRSGRSRARAEARAFWASGLECSDSPPPESHVIRQVRLGLSERLHEACLLGHRSGLLQERPDVPDGALVIVEDRQMIERYHLQPRFP